ncbi:MAG: hypothetical protein ACLPYS_18995 [Vulcanimicrobiaceae bacterium]
MNRASSSWLAPDVLRDERHGLWIVVRPASTFVGKIVDERRAEGARRFEADRWTAVDALALVLIGLFYGALGYALWQLSS